MLGVAGVQSKISQTSQGTAARLFVIDYSQMVAEVYTGVINYAINSARVESWQTSVDRFPSFVPVWRYCHFQPSRAQQESLDHVWIPQEGSIWHLRGVQVGIVTQASPPERKSGFGHVKCSVSDTLRRMLDNVSVSETRKYKFLVTGHASAILRTSDRDRFMSIQHHLYTKADEQALSIGSWFASNKGAVFQGTAKNTVRVGDIVAHVVGLPEGKPVQLAKRRFVEGTSSYRAESRRSAYLTLRPRAEGGHIFLGFANLVLKEGKSGGNRYRETLELQWLIKMFVEDENDDTYRKEAEGLTLMWQDASGGLCARKRIRILQRLVSAHWSSL
ncbi:hypothetical protein Slin15195_G124600 [Septoria linicola]|uniref:Uncharacterized protein n=1 Tax=Septoria linicola TaxID=215465 RepID=A0A9Q9BA30_9PEZI|nr:hypothetical protein Slin15195_G124600 [Septoria linicola]